MFTYCPLYWVKVIINGLPSALTAAVSLFVIIIISHYMVKVKYSLPSITTLPVTFIVGAVVVTVPSQAAS